MMKSNKQHRIFLPILFFFSLVLINISCSKIDSLPQLEITVLSESGNPVPGIPVAIFEDQREWSMLENPVQAWRETDQEGKVLFTDLMEMEYYFYADGGSLNNLGDKIRIMERLKLNEKRKITIVIK